MENINAYENDILQNLPDPFLRPGGFELTERLLKLADVPKGADILDIGCGTGAAVRFLTQSGYNAIGADKSKILISRGESLFNGVRLFAAEAEKLPFDDSSFGAVLFECSLSLMDAPDALCEACRVLKPDGRLMVSDVFSRREGGLDSGSINMRGLAEFVKLMEEQGFRVMYTEDKTLVFESFIAQVIMSTGSLDALFGCGEWEVIKKARPGYFLITAHKEATTARRSVQITPLDRWVQDITGGDLSAYQLQKLNETLKIAQNGYYYKKYLPERLGSLSELAVLPPIDAEVLTRDGTGLVCVPQSEILRIVTLETSGTSGQPKRVFFTEEDQELTVDYFAHGLPTVVKPGGTAAILLPCERPGGVGDLIARGLARIPVTPVRHGYVSGLAECAGALIQSGTESLIGTPVQVYNIARYCELNNFRLNIRSVLLSTDNIPRVIVRELGRIWGCEVFEHYGMTETGLGGAIDCEAHDGYHIRENDLLFEVLDTDGNPVPDGEYGELVFTTLTRRGMPLIRYRTGDISKIIPGRCGCGSGLKRIAPVTGRIGGDIVTECGTVIRMREFDEALFALPQISDFMICVSPGRDLIKIDIDTQLNAGEIMAEDVLDVLYDAALIDGLETEVNITRRANILSAPRAKRTVKALP